MANDLAKLDGMPNLGKAKNASAFLAFLTKNFKKARTLSSPLKETC